MDQRIQARIQARVLELKALGVPIDLVDKIVKAENSDHANEIELVPNADAPGKGVSSTADYELIRRATAHGYADGHELIEAKRRALELESQAEELKQTRDAELFDRVASLEDAVMGTAGGLASHLVQHQLQAQGQLEALDPGASIQFMLAGLNAKQRAKLVENLTPELRQALEAAERGDTPALPSTDDEDDSRTVEAPQKKRGFLGFGA